MSADLVVDYTQDIAQQLEASGQKHVDMVLSTARSAENTRRRDKVEKPIWHGEILLRPECSVGSGAADGEQVHAASAAVTTGKSISV
jgi:hypothetical protein